MWACLGAQVEIKETLPNTGTWIWKEQLPLRMLLGSRVLRLHLSPEGCVLGYFLRDRVILYVE